MSPQEKHLEMIQAVISRLANNSYAYKGWAITVSAGLIAFLADKHAHMILSALYPIGAFWMLDAHSLALERNYRKLYDEARRETIDPYSMSISGIRKPFSDQMNALTSLPILAFYGSMLIFVLLVVRWMA